VYGREKHSIWLVPAGDVYARLADTIEQLGAAYAAPKFPPHVTLLGALTGDRRGLIAACGRVAAVTRPFTIRLRQVDFTDMYFRCLFVRAALSLPLQTAYRAARREFSGRQERRFMPHLSLLYGRFPRTLKEQLVAELQSDFDLEFKVRALQLYRTQGEPRCWRRIATFGLE